MKKWKVIRSDESVIEAVADYCCIEEGVLKFKDDNMHIIQAYNYDTWLKVYRT